MTDNRAGFDARIDLRPRSLDEVLDLTFVYLSTHARDFAKPIAFLVLTSLALLALLKFAAGATWGVLAATTVVLGPLIERITTSYAKDHLFNRKKSIGSAAVEALNPPHLALFAMVVLPLPFLPMLVTEFAEEWVNALSMVVLFPWPFILAGQIYFTNVVLLERLKARAAISRTSVLVRSRYGRAFALILLSFLGKIGFAMTLELLARFVMGVMFEVGTPLDSIFETTTASWPTICGYLLASPFVALCRLFDYIDARTNIEGWDIQVRFRAILARGRRT